MFIEPSATTSSCLSWPVSKFIWNQTNRQFDNTPDCSAANYGWYIWAWDQALASCDFRVGFRAEVPGFAAFDQTPWTNIKFQAGTATHIKEVTTSLSCTWGSISAETYYITYAAILKSFSVTCTGSTASIIDVSSSYCFTINPPESAFVSITLTPQISIYTVDATIARAAPYTVTLVLREFYSGLTSTTTFPVTLICLGVTSVPMTGSISSFTYYYSDPTVNTNLPTYVAVPNCGNMPLTYSLQLQAGGTVPSAFSLNLTASPKLFVIT